MSRDYAEHVCDLLFPFGVVMARPMFGGFGLYRDQVIFALIADDVLYFKVDDGNRSAYDVAGMLPFKPFADKPTTMSYWEVPADLFEDQELLCQWARHAFDAALRAQKKKKPKKAAAK